MITFPLKHELASKRFQKKLKILLFIIFCSLLINGIGKTYQYENQTASVYPMNELLEDLAECESDNNPAAINSKEIHGTSWGKYQYRIDTWNWALERYELGKLDILNGEHQDIVTTKLLSEGRWKNWKNCLSKYF